MNARDLQNKKKPTSTPTVYLKGEIVEKKPKKSLEDRLSELSMDTFADRIKFLFTFVIIGLAVVFVGDLLKLIPLKGSGITFQVLGTIIIFVGFLGPFAKFMEDNS